jgi:hypothetical protein
MTNAAIMDALARVIDEELNGELKGNNRDVGFCLMVFPFHSPGVVNYISNGKQHQMIELLKQQLKRFEEGKRRINHD